MSLSQKDKGKLTLIGISLLFFIPIVTAWYLVFYTDFMQGSKGVEHGTLISPVVSVGPTKAKEIYEEILNNEIINGMPEDIVSKGKNLFEERLTKIDWNKYYESWPFNESALALYEWAPIAENLKILDRKIVLNSMILKWENVQKEFYQLVKKI